MGGNGNGQTKEEHAAEGVVEIAHKMVMASYDGSAKASDGSEKDHAMQVLITQCAARAITIAFGALIDEGVPKDLCDSMEGPAGQAAEIIKDQMKRESAGLRPERPARDLHRGGRRAMRRPR